MPDHAIDLLKSGETAVMIFTRGDKFYFDKTTGTGFSGNWKIRRDSLDRVIIYHRPRDWNHGAEIYVGKFEKPLAEAIEPATPKERKERRRINFSNLKHVGTTEVNFREFTGNYRRDFCFINREPEESVIG